MQTNVSTRSAVLALILLGTFLISWEVYLRHNGVIPDYDDGAELYSHVRDEVYEPSDKSTVFIGSSRIKYDIDIPTWEKLYGTHAVQLAMTGSSPLHMLDDLAADPKFKGKLVVDVTEVLFFSHHGNEDPDAGISYYRKRTPAQKASFMLDEPLESHLAFLNKDHYTITGLLGRVPVKNRPMVYPFLDFPFGFDITLPDRQNKMTPRFVADTNLHNQVKGIWGLLAQDPTPPMHGHDLDSLLLTVKQDIDKIKARGGDVIFTRTPSTGMFYMGEQHGFPRAAYWDRLLSYTNCKGFYFKDNPVTAKLDCPEWSHLSPDGAIVYTTSLVGTLKQANW
jgi:hypothetical protein